MENAGDEIIVLSDDDVPGPSGAPDKGANGHKIKPATARKTMSSFTPSNQFKKRRPSLITLDSDTENEEVPKQDPKKKRLNGVETAINMIIDSCRNCPNINKVEVQKIEVKLQKRSTKIHKDFLEDNGLADFLKKRSHMIDSSPGFAFKYLKEILDELLKYTVKNVKENGEQSSSIEKEDDEEAEADERTQRHIKKLEKALRACGKHIRKLEASEMSLDGLDEEDSNYVLESKYKNRYMAIYRKISQLKGLSSSLNRKADHKFRTQTSSSCVVNRELESFVNKRGKGQSQDMVPDYTDVLGFYEKAKHVEKDLSEDTIKSESRTTFEIVVKNLKRRRLHDLQDNLDGYLESEHLGTSNEEALKDPELNSVLARQAVEGEAKIAKVVDEFAKKQEEIKEEPKEEDEDESDTEDEDGEVDLDIPDDANEDEEEENEKGSENQEENGDISSNENVSDKDKSDPEDINLVQEL